MSLAHRIRVALRKSAVLASHCLPTRPSIRIERYLRGREDALMVADSDIVVVSYGKSGRTWLMVMLSRYYQLLYGLPANRLLDHDGLHRLNTSVPRIFFTHDNYVSDFTGDGRKSLYAGKKLILLVRHPADTAVSQFFQWQHRMRRRKKLINGYPEGDLPLIDFVLGEAAGIPKIANFMNRWAADLGSVRDLLVVRYETLRQQTQDTLGQILRFIGEEPNAEQLGECVRFASVENMRALERQAFFKGSGTRLKPADPSNPESYKVRRAKVGGYRDYFEPDEAARIDGLVARSLSPVFGYSGTLTDPRVI